MDLGKNNPLANFKNLFIIYGVIAVVVLGGACRRRFWEGLSRHYQRNLGCLWRYYH